MSQAPRSDGRPSRPRPVERFLGVGEASGGPFALLGLSPTAISDDLVLSALDRQIERVARHPECDTPEADEVRLALHAAAAQLLDPIVRRHLVAKWTGTAPPAVPHPPVPAPPIRRSGPERLLEGDAILTLALFGGWNQRAMRRLLAIASRRGMGPPQVAATLRTLATRRRPSRSGSTRATLPMRRARSRDQFEALASAPAVAVSEPLPRSPPSVPAEVRIASDRPAPPVVQRRQPAPRRVPIQTTDPEDAARETLRKAMIFGGVGLGALVVAVMAIIALTSSTPGPKVAPTTAPVPGSAASTGAAPSTVAAVSPSAPPQSPYPAVIPAPEPQPQPVRRASIPPPSDTTDPALLVRELAACAQGVQSEPAEAQTRFEAAVAHLSHSWPQVPHDRLIACHDAVIEYLYKAADSPDLTLRALEAIGSGAAALGAQEPPPTDRVVPAAWSTGMLVRLARERDLSAAAKSFVEARLGVALGPARPTLDQSFEAGANAALAIIPQRLTPPASQGADAQVSIDAWQEWARAVDGLTGPDAAGRLRLLLSGLETLLIQGPEPDANKGIAEVVADLVPRLTWRPEDESRRWLLRWFDDRRISAADLHAVTSALATRSSADGVDLTMVLSTSASDKARADLRSRYATVWSMQQTVNRDDLAASLIKAAKDAVAASLNPGDESQELGDAAALARVSESASWQWRGETNEASVILGDIRGPIDQALADPTPANLKSIAGQTDGGWAEKYLAAAQKTRAKRDMLDQLAVSHNELGPVDAEVVAREAVIGSAAELRTPAQEIVKSQAENPAMINAMLELLPRMPRSPGNSSLLEVIAQGPLPSIKDAAWPIVARRILVERLLEAIAAESPHAKVDRLARLLSASYRSMAAPAPLTTDQRAQPRPPAASVSAAQVYQKWRTAADALVPTTPPPVPLDQLDRRRSGRIGQARGLVQAFSAEQTSLCEIMAYVLSVEQPARVDQIKQVLDRLADDRRHAPTIIRQINATERAIVQLWLIRYQEDPA